MKILLDTNIIIHRERTTVVRDDIGELFYWINRLWHRKYIHPIVIEEIRKYADEAVRDSLLIKIKSYCVLVDNAPIHAEVQKLRDKIDRPECQNDLNDTRLLNELFLWRVDVFITEDKKILEKARQLWVANRVLSIESFIERVLIDNPWFIDYKATVLSKEKFGNLSLNDPFFDSFREDYKGFDEWFQGKSDESAFVYKLNNEIRAFLYLKVEDGNEVYANITPMFPPKKRLKIGTLKVDLNGYKLGERFLKIIFDHAVRFNAEEIYVTIFDKDEWQKRLIDMLKDWWFVQWGTKKTSSWEEMVFVRDFSGWFNITNPRLSYPKIGTMRNRAFIVPIYKEYHTDLFPDSIVKGEVLENNLEVKPHRNAISKIYVSRSWEKDLRKWDLIIFYRTGWKYRGVITTIWIVEELIDDIKSEAEFIEICKDRTVFGNKELSKIWNYKKSRPFIVKFLSSSSFFKHSTLYSKEASNVSSESLFARDSVSSFSLFWSK